MGLAPAAWDDAEGASRARDLFASCFAAKTDGVWAAPGRVNLIEDHVDYNQGRCLPMALPHRTFVAASRRGAIVLAPQQSASSIAVAVLEAASREGLAEPVVHRAAPGSPAERVL
ncbi:galactokinase family protein [Arsenicicoccus bolidensis]|uniref:galactokinase family protein n=1 Tax=Arsenicicoccus bolidensis TaxID=229480 RepID=UPI000427CE41